MGFEEIAYADDSIAIRTGDRAGFRYDPPHQD